MCHAKPKRRITYNLPTRISFICTETIWYGRLQTMPEVKFEKLNDDEVVVKLKEYQYVIGSLTYASIEMRPNI